MRGESLAVPFEHSLREFLEGAADMYQRSLDELEARAPKPGEVLVHISIAGRPDNLTPRLPPPFYVKPTVLLKNVAVRLSAIIPPAEVEFTMLGRPGPLIMDRSIAGNGITSAEIHLTARQATGGVLPAPRTVTVHIKVEGKSESYGIFEVQSNIVPLKNLSGNLPIPSEDVEFTIPGEHGVPRSLVMAKTIDENRIKGVEVYLTARRKGAEKGKGRS
ncbi:hypothetical protein D9611_010742 [Ephemerocybe angulata]|uniref:Uncharacterized protein n=1 Tax=Ephemerocybe angulata TaxID=980116 RepID=A0A8H5BC21_9AGAR|nr:hypothetical protein D9611_010742 [Tulosesus angulatus]